MAQAVSDYAHNLPVAAGSLDQYIQLAYSLPVLSPEEERALALRLRDEGDVDAARQLVLHNLRFVIHVARGYTGYGLPLADLIQEGSIGLMKAVKRFDPEVGVRLVSFAVHWIRAEIHEYVLRNWRIVKMATTKAQRKLFFNLRKAKKRLGWMNEEEVNAVAEDLGVTAREVRDMESRLNQPDVPMEMDSDDEEAPLSPMAYLSAPGADPAPQLEAEDYAQVRDARLQEALADLDERSRSILQQRWFAEPKRTLQELAEEFGVSGERIRQIEAAAMKKLRVALA
ncbi:MAG: RNA polymerase sigma factor RpoH [Gammaproteobacteria bacterium]|nr:RNA polymerase sigma factor RpoH [Gammaproteobacteria bacterium]MDE0301689.1 RNA polymerase sigma factor RpoH [Gammaproteobacteria bacterium]MDE0611354.1 RNA polymerase sigma factor RpoH [Gammaproteobacteria bacterium]